MSRAIIDIHRGIARNPKWRTSQPVDFRLMEGEQVAIVGPNGSGKSLMVDIITGAHPILSGDGNDSYARYDFGPGRSDKVYENLHVITFQDAYSTTEGYYYYQLRYNQGELTDEQNLYKLSSGELRRYQLRRALEGNPRVLILDNPFIGLDTAARHMLDDTLSRLTSTTDMQLIVVVSREEDVPRCVTRRVVTPSVCPPDPRPIRGELSDEKREYGVSCDPIVAFRHVSIHYDERYILKDLDWTINRGEHWALTGPNGSGKSTLLSLICADNPQAYANDISLFGRRRGSGESIWDIKRQIGYVSPEMHQAFLRNYPVVDIVASGLYDTIGLYRKPKAEDLEPCMEWMRVFGVDRYRDTSMLNLSSGEQRRVLLARAFVKSPSLLILDEPMHGLDNQWRQRVKEVIDQYMSDENRTLIMVSHYEEEFPQCIDHRMELERNK